MAAELARANIQFEVICEDALRDIPVISTFSAKHEVDPHAVLPKALRNVAVLLTPAATDFDEAEAKRFVRGGGRIVTAENRDWIDEVRLAIKSPSVRLEGASRVRVLVRDQPNRSLVHMLNLAIERVSSFQDRVIPVRDVRLSIRIPFRNVHSVQALTADDSGTAGPLPYSILMKDFQILVETSLPQLEISTILVIE
jgi:hypothetical protein